MTKRILILAILILLATTVGVATAWAQQPSETTTATTVPYPADMPDDVALTKALNILANQGFEGISNLRREGRQVLATVLEQGQHKNVTVDVVTGQLTTQ